MDKCFKIHGYPSKPAGRGRGGYVSNQNRKVYNAWTENEKQDPPAEVQSPSLPGLNPEQSKQLYQFLSNLTSSSQQHKHNDQDSIGAHMARTFPPSTTVYNASAICSLCKLESGSWILDSGASDHMSFDVSGLHDLKLLDIPVLVSLPDGTKVEVTHSGKLRLHDDLELHHVLLVPHFKYNLLSVRRLANQLHC